jgi:hypothetical protein
LFLWITSKSDLTALINLNPKWSDKWTSEPRQYTPIVKSLANVFVGAMKKRGARRAVSLESSGRLFSFR